MKSRKPYSLLKNEKGIALAMILVLAVIALAIIAGMIYMITSTTQISGMQKRYKTALEASLGGADVAFQLIAARGNPNIDNINFLQTASEPCLIAKLNTNTSDANWAACGGGVLNKATSISIDPTDPDTYDFKFDLGSSPYPTYRSYAKIVNTVEGNSGGDEGLIGKGVISSGSGEITVMSIPYFYTIEVNSENVNTPSERAKLTILYEY